MSSITHELKHPIKYSNGTGTEVECNFIELRSPTGKVSHICCDIEGIVQSAVLKMSDSLDESVVEQAKETAAAAIDDGDQKDGDGILAVMMGGGADMNKIVLLFRELFKEVAYMGGEKKITSTRLDDMDHKDLRAMIGVYAANFILS